MQPHPMDQASASENVCSRIRHEIVQPTNALRLLISQLKGSEPGDRQDKIVSAATNGLATLQHSLDQLTTFISVDQASSAELEAVDIKELFSSSVSAFRDNFPGVDVVAADELTAPIQLPLDADLLARAFRELAVNAVQHAPSSLIRIGLEQRTDAVVWSVTDYGPGLSSAEKEKALQPFVSMHHPKDTAAPPMGLGLAVADRAMRAMNGALHLQSNDDWTGLSAELHLPRAAN